MEKQNDVLEQELTFGQKAVGVSFNPSNNEEVDDVKQKCADLIDILHGFRTATNNAEKKRLYSEAITNLQTGQMYAVKGLTWQY